MSHSSAPGSEEPPLTLAAISSLLDSKLGPMNDKLTTLQTAIELAFDSAGKASEAASKALAEANTLREENTKLKKDIKDMKEYLLNLDNYSRRDSLNIYGIPEETTSEDCREQVWQLFERMGIRDARGILFSRIHRIGKRVKGKHRPIRVRFQYYPDLERVYDSRRLTPGSEIGISKVYAPEVEKNRSLLHPYVKAAYRYRDTLSSDAKSKFNIKFKDDKLIINEKVFSIENIQELPPQLTPQHSAVRENDTHLYFWSKHAPFSNHFEAEFTLDGIKFQTSEQYIMYSKALLFKDTDTACKIVKSSDAATAKSLGKKVTGFDMKVWNSRAHDIVKTAVHAKFQQNPTLLTRLLDTKRKVLVEASPHDKFWGAGLHHSDDKILDQKLWPGKNMMGKILMDIRSELSS